MPFRSTAQRKKFYSLAKQGKMPMATIDKWNAATPKGPLPQHVDPTMDDSPDDNDSPEQEAKERMLQRLMKRRGK